MRAFDSSAQETAITDEDRPTLNTNPKHNNYVHFQLAGRKGWVDYLNQLVGSPHVVPQLLFDWTWKHDHPMTLGALYVMNLRLRFNPAANDNKAILEASENGRLEVVRLLLNDTRVDPTASRNLAIQWASGHGHHDVVHLLLEDGRAEPTVHLKY